MKMKMGVLAAAIVCAAFLSACGGNSAFAGKWYLMEGEGRYIPEDIELLKDGTGFALEQAVTWKTEGDRFFITHPDLAMAFNYEISGSRIDFTNDEGETFVYMKLGGPAALVGEWEMIALTRDGERMTQPEGEDWLISAYNSDGTIILLGADDVPPRKWAADKDTLYEIDDEESSNLRTKFSYKIEGTTLTTTLVSISGGSIIGEGLIGEGRFIVESKKK